MCKFCIPKSKSRADWSLIYFFKVLSLLDVCFDLISSPSPSMKIQIMVGKITINFGVLIPALEGHFFCPRVQIECAYYIPTYKDVSAKVIFTYLTLNLKKVFFYLHWYLCNYIYENYFLSENSGWLSPAAICDYYI